MTWRKRTEESANKNDTEKKFDFIAAVVQAQKHKSFTMQIFFSAK